MKTWKQPLSARITRQENMLLIAPLVGVWVGGWSGGGGVSAIKSLYMPRFGFLGPSGWGQAGRSLLFGCLEKKLPL